MNVTSGGVLLGSAIVAVAVAVVAGLVVLGSPADERARRLDRRRVADLQAIAAATDLYWTRHARLPASLEQLSAEPGVGIRATDPTGSNGYDYQPVDSTRYELCAAFDAETEETVGHPRDNLWAHGSGRHCFGLEAETIERTEGRNLRVRPLPPNP